MAPSRTTALRRVLGVAPLHGLRSAGPCVIRVGCGVVMAVHGVDKLVQGPTGFGAFLASLDVPAPSAVGWAVALGESLGGLFLVVGLLSRLTALLLSVHLCVALALVNTDTGFITPQQGAATGAGAEFPLMLIAGFLAVALSGPGPLALDRVIGIERATPDSRAPEPAGTGRRAVATGPGPSAVRVSLISGVIGGVIGAVMSAVANYLVVGMPSSAAANAGNHAVSGLISGFLADFLGLWTHLRRSRRVPAAASVRPGDQPEAAPTTTPVSPA